VSYLENSYQSSDLMFQVNCLEPHPNLPAMATSGLDHSVKIWLPTSTKEPDVKAIENVSNRCNHINIFYFAFFVTTLVSRFRYALIPRLLLYRSIIHTIKAVRVMNQAETLVLLTFVKSNLYNVTPTSWLNHRLGKPR